MKADADIDLAAACPKLQLGEDEILYASGSKAISFPEEGNDIDFEVEDDLFWFRHQNDCKRELARNFPLWVMWTWWFCRKWRSDACS